MEPRKWWQIKRYRPEGGMPGIAPQDSRGGSQPRGSPHLGWGKSGEQAKRASQRNPRPASIVNPFRGGTTPGFERSAVRPRMIPPPKKRHPPTHRLHRDEAIGAGSDRAGEAEGSKRKSGGSLRAGHLPRTQGECRAHCS